MRLGSVSSVGGAPGGSSSCFTEAFRSSTPALPWMLQSCPHCCCRLFPDGGRLWHKNGAMARLRNSRAPVPLDARRLEEIALRYVGRYATSRAKLTAYLSRKVRERGWSGEREPDLDALVERFADLGYIDDAAYALSKSQALSNRGYGLRRLEQKLRLAGIEDGDAAEARSHAEMRA